MNQPVSFYLLNLLEGKGAHAPFEKAVADLRPDLRGVKPPGAAHTVWQLVDHMRFTLNDMIEFSTNENYQEPHWPDGYWPATEAPPDEAAWDRSVKEFETGMETMKQLVRECADLLSPFPREKGQPLLRNVLVLADHNAYHIGQIILLRRILGAWE